MKESIVVRGARQHNLKGFDVEIPRRTVTVITGPSGSGKSSLAFDTIYAEGQRRYVESLSSYARQFLERMEKPDVDAIEGIAPAIAIRQKNSIRNPRSTVGTTTEIHDYLRLLWARVGRTICRQCGKEVERETLNTIIHLRARETFELLKRTLDEESFINFIGEGIFITGGCSLLRGIDNLAEEIFEIPARVAHAQTMSGLTSAFQNPQLSTAIGLIKYARAVDHLNINAANSFKPRLCLSR